MDVCKREEDEKVCVRGVGDIVETMKKEKQDDTQSNTMVTGERRDANTRDRDDNPPRHVLSRLLRHT